MARKPKSRIIVLPEREVVRAVQNFFAFSRNVNVWRRNTGAVTADYGNRKRFVRFGVPGMSDLFGIIRKMTCPKCGRVVGRGVHLEIECKRYGGRITAEQKEYMGKIREMGGVAILAVPCPSDSDPTGFQALREKLATVDQEVCSDCSRR